MIICNNTGTKANQIEKNILKGNISYGYKNLGVISYVCLFKDKVPIIQQMLLSTSTVSCCQQTWNALTSCSFLFEKNAILLAIANCLLYVL